MVTNKLFTAQARCGRVSTHRELHAEYISEKDKWQVAVASHSPIHTLMLADARQCVSLGATPGETWGSVSCSRTL